MRRVRTAGLLAAEVVAWVLLFPVAVVMLLLRVLGHGYASVDTRVWALLQWYPAAWRERHGEEFAAILQDAIEGGHDGLRLSLDVARAGIAERVRTLHASRLGAGLAAGLGWTMIIPQGIVAAVLSQVGGVPPSWFLALHVAGPARWLVVGGMVAGGAVLVATSFRLFARTCSPRRPARG